MREHGSGSWDERNRTSTNVQTLLWFLSSYREGDRSLPLLVELLQATAPCLHRQASTAWRSWSWEAVTPAAFHARRRRSGAPSYRASG